MRENRRFDKLWRFDRLHTEWARPLKYLDIEGLAGRGE
jgi:hypothetical protein